MKRYNASERKRNMNHEAFEKEMIDTVNRNAEEKKQHTDTTVHKSVFTKTDVLAFRVGLRRTLFALITAAIFAFSVFCFIAVAMVHGYLAVALFIVALMALGFSFLFLYAQGITRVESKSEKK